MLVYWGYCRNFLYDVGAHKNASSEGKCDELERETTRTPEANYVVLRRALSVVEQIKMCRPTMKDTPRLLLTTESFGNDQIPDKKSTFLTMMLIVAILFVIEHTVRAVLFAFKVCSLSSVNLARHYRMYV